MRFRNTSFEVVMLMGGLQHVFTFRPNLDGETFIPATMKQGGETYTLSKEGTPDPVLERVEEDFGLDVVDESADISAGGDDQ